MMFKVKNVILAIEHRLQHGEADRAAGLVTVSRPQGRFCVLGEDEKS